jgi:hypothetical protein
MGLFQQPVNPWAVELQCPRCGAPVTMEEADRILTCAFCRVRLLLIHPGCPQYYLNPFQEDQPAQDMIYIPYWRIRGMAFSCLQPQGKDRFVDVTFLAAETPGMPPYLGLQSRAFKLRFLSSAKLGRIIEPQRPLDGFLSQVAKENMFFPEPPDCEISPRFQQTFIGETISQVYAPIFFKAGGVYDGLGQRLLDRVKEADFESLPFISQDGVPPVRFLPVMCPYCGADLEGEKDTQVLLCRNCDRVWDYSRNELKQIEFGIMKGGDEGPAFYLPFWRIKTGIKGWPPQIQRPLTRLNLGPGQSSATGSKEENDYWLPAFKLSPSQFLMISRAISLRQPLDYSLINTLPKGQYYPVNLPWEQAKEGLKVLIADFLKTHLAPKISQIQIEPSEHLLILIPFHLRGHELVHQTMSVGISLNALHFGRFL